MKCFSFEFIYGLEVYSLGDDTSNHKYILQNVLDVKILM